MRRLIIAEKPSLGRIIAAAIDGPKEQKKTYIRCAGGTVIAWSAGHILSQKMPEHYDPKYKTWALEGLPCIPAVWENMEKPDKEGETYLAELRKTIKGFLSQADEVVNAGDAGREGQLLVDELLEFYEYKGKVLRLWLENTTPEHVKSRLAAMKSNDEYLGLRQAAQARSRADWILGLNMTRLYTILANKNGYKGTPVTIGRVQTPVLGLIVNRDHEIENFVSKPFWTLEAQIGTEQGMFSARWKPKDTQEGLDEEGRIIDVSVVRAVEEKVKGKTGVISELEKKRKKNSPPLPYSLSGLQIDCSKSYDLSPSDTLAAVQALYERGIVSYPRSDCNYIPEDQHKEAGKILQGVQAILPALAAAIGGADINRKSAAWNDKKIGEHYAIIPTGRAENLGGDERRVYEKIALRYTLQFYPDFEYNETTVNVEAEGENFIARGREVLEKGWKKIFSESNSAESQEEERKDGDDNNISLPPMKKGDAARVESTKIQEKKTTPPARFTEALIIDAMRAIHRYVADPEIRKQLKESDGIGTEATRAEIIKNLFLRNYVSKQGKQVISTEKGRSLISCLPASLSTPDLTALWEREIKKIHDGAAPRLLDSFIAAIAGNVDKLVSQGIADKEKIWLKSEVDVSKPYTLKTKTGTSIDGDQAADSPSEGCSCFRCKSALRHLNGKNGPFWACTNPECKATFNDKGGKPEKPHTCPKCKNFMRRLNGKNGEFLSCKCGFTLSITEKGKTQKTARCPKCRGILKQIPGKKGLFWACSNSECKMTFDDAGNKPVINK